jgi:hypothetical protein
VRWRSRGDWASKDFVKNLTRAAAKVGFLGLESDSKPDDVSSSCLGSMPAVRA